MSERRITSPDGRRVVVITEQAGRYAARLYVNAGETATASYGRARTPEGALRLAASLLGPPVGPPDFIRRAN
jgi:hypothetical protein